MKKLIIFESILILFFVLSWNVNKAFSENYFYGYSTRDCGWIISHAKEDDIAELSVHAYILGMTTGIITLGNRGGSNASAEAVIAETMNYCKANPVEPFYDAIFSTYEKITR